MTEKLLGTIDLKFKVKGMDIVNNIIPIIVLTYCVSKCVHFAAVILEINFQFLAYM